MHEKQISIHNLNKYYGRKQAICDIDLTIGQGMFGLLGRNGAGKTTLMKILATLLNKNSGSVTTYGIPIENAGEIRKITGYLPQDFSMYPGMTVYEAMDYLGVLSGLDGVTRRKRIPVFLQRVNLYENSKSKVRSLSGGMKRRLGIAQAILHDPRVLIVDEPTAGLDPEERIRFRNLLGELAEDRIVILSTHIVGDIEATCDRIAILESGKLLYNGHVGELVKTAENKVYSLAVPKKELTVLKEKYIVTGTLITGDTVNVRLIADNKPDCSALKCEPNIEDAYMMCMHSYSIENRKSGGEI